MGATLDHITFLSDSAIKQAVGRSPGWRDFGLKAWARSRDLCPKDTGKLAASMLVKFDYGVDAHIEIGSVLQTPGNKPANLFALIELGTEAHVLPAGKLIAFNPGGGTIFRRSTGSNFKIPAHKKNPFVERAAQQTIHGLGGITLVAI